MPSRDVKTGKDRLTLAGHADWILALAYAPDGKRLASGGSGRDSTVRIWNVASGKEVHSFSGLGQGAWSLAFSPRGDLLAAGDALNKIRIWEVASGKERQTFSHRKLEPGWKPGPSHAGGHIFSLAFSPDGQWLASASEDRTVLIWKVGAQATPIPSPTEPGLKQAGGSQRGPSLRTDPRLAVRITLNLKAPLLPVLLKHLQKRTGLAMVAEAGTDLETPVFGSISWRNVPAWAVMEQVAGAKRIKGHWEKTGQGYRLVGSVKKVPEGPGPKQPPKQAGGSKGVLPCISTSGWRWLPTTTMWLPTASVHPTQGHENSTSQNAEKAKSRPLQKTQ